MNILINKAAQLVNGIGCDWSFCGGYAIDLFLGRETRPHYDLDISTYWPHRDNIIRHMQETGWTVYEACGGGMVHRIIDLAGQKRLKRNIFCVAEGNTNFHLKDCGNEMFRCEIERIPQTRLDYIEFLFNTRTDRAFIYARNKKVTRAIEKAVLYNGSIPYLAPELVLLYKSTDIKREGYQQDFELARQKMSPEGKTWLREALEICYPGNHPWKADLEDIPVRK